MSANGLRKFNHHPSGMKESFLGDYYYDTEVDAFISTQQATIERLTEQLKDMVETYQYEASSENPTLLAAKALIAEIEASNE